MDHRAGEAWIPRNVCFRPFVALIHGLLGSMQCAASFLIQGFLADPLGQALRLQPAHP